MSQQDEVHVADVATVALTTVTREPAPAPAPVPPIEPPSPTQTAQQATLAQTGADPPPEG